MQGFIFPVHVFMDDTDYSGVVYHANYLKYLEHGRSNAAKQLGWGLDQLQKQQIYFVVRNVTIDYLSPAKLHDDLEVATRVEKIGRTSLTFQQTIRFAKQPEKLLCTATVIIVCIDGQLKPRELPQELLSAFKKEDIEK